MGRNRQWDRDSHGIGNGTGNKPIGTWTLAGHTYTNYAEFCEAGAAAAGVSDAERRG